MSCYDSPKAIAHRGRNYAAAIDTCASVRAASELYADALLTYGPDGVDWRQVNGACLRRWQPSTVDRIKRSAWKAIKGEARRSSPRAPGGEGGDRG